MLWSKKKCVVLDMDGTVYLGARPIVGAVSFIQRHWTDLDFYFLTNNTSKSLATYVTKLNCLGIAAKKEQLLSPVYPLVDFLRAEKMSRIYLVGTLDFTQEVHELLPELVIDEKAEGSCDAVVLAYDTELTYEKLVRSAHLLQQGLPFVATHPDLVCPSPEGPIPDVGSFLALYEKATGRRPSHIFGKPDPLVLSPLWARYAKEDMVMVGDRLSTDMKLAENAGIDFALVLSGEAKREDLAAYSYTPAAILADLGEAERSWS